MTTWGFETQQVHAGAVPDPTTGARAVPIYQTTSFVFNDTAHAANLFNLTESGHTYTRLMNPTTGVLEERLAALEGGVGALALASGQAAETLAILNLARAGDHIVSAASLYGGTYNLFASTLPKLGIECSFVENPDNMEEWQAALRPNTKALYGETIGNPKGNILDIAPIAEIAHTAGVPLIIDNTFASPYLCTPFTHGADIVVHSCTKFIGGHGTSIGGAIVDAGSFDFSAAGERFPDFVTPDPTYNGVVYADTFGPAAYIVKARTQLLRDFGPALSPTNAFLFLQGLETLSLRMERHVENTLAVAEFLASRPEVTEVNYAGLAGNPYHEHMQKYCPKGAGAILSFELKDGVEAGRRFVENVELFSHLANVGDVRSLIIHPASTTHAQLSAQEQLQSGVTPGMVRLSIGIETIDDLLADLDQGFLAGKK